MMKNQSRAIATILLAAGLSACGSDGSDDNVILPPPPPADTAAPTIAVNDQSVDANSADNVLSLTVADNESTTDQITITAVSSQQGIVADANLIITNDASGVSLTVTPQSDIAGDATITITATDEAQNSASEDFLLSVLVNQISATELANQLTSIDENGITIPINAVEIQGDPDEVDFSDLFVDQQ